MWVRARCAHVAVVGALAVVAFAQRPGATTFDTKLDLAENPWAFLDRALSLWNPEANFGELQNQAYGYLFPIGPFFAAADAMGLPPWLAQRLWTALLLAIAYGGVVTLGRALGIGTRPARIVAALAYALCPRMVTTLGPISAEALVVAMLPWVVVPLVRWRRWGVRRAAAFSALAIVGMGAANATLVVAVLPLPLLVALTQPHGVRGRLTAWWIACVTLACAWWVVPLLLLDRYSPPFLDYIESAANTTGGVALPDALSGSTHWVARVVIGGEPWWPSGHALATSGWLVIATSVVGLAGLASLLDVRMPQRTALLASATIGLVVLCLGWNGSFGSPWASQWYALLDGPLAAFRNVHKFDPLVRLPVALGIAHGIGLALTWGRGGRLAKAQPKILAGCLAVCSVAALIPALSPGLRPGPGWEETPTWWNEAAAYVAKRDAHSRTLVLPSAGFGTQVWGRTVDEPLQPLASAPWVSRSQVFLGGEGGARLLEAVDGWVESGRGSPALGEVLARAGIRFVIVRGDLDRHLAGTPPVAVVRQALERSGGIVKVAQFGPELRYPDAAGLRVFGWHLDSATPAIEVFEVDADVGVARIAALGEVTGVTGGPESIPRLVEDGLLDPDQPAVLAMDSPSRPGRWLVTDDLAHRERGFGRIRENLGPVRTEEEPPRQARAATDLVSPNAEGHLAVARYVGITRVSASSSRGYADSSSPTDTSLGPWSAIDGDPFTAWRSDAGGEPVGEWLRVDFDEPRSMRHLEIRFVASSLVGPRIAAVDVRTEAGVRRSTVRGDGTTERITVPRGLTDFVSVHVARVDGSEDGEIGVLSLELPDVTPQRMVVAPSGRPAEMRAVGAPAGLSFHRLDPTRGACVVVVFSTRCDPNLPARGDEPTNLARGFTTHASATYRLEGTVLARPGDAVQRLLEPLGGIRTEGSSTLAGDPAVAAARAVDGNGATSWMADPFDPLPTLRLDWSEERIINGLRIMPSTEPVAARPTTVDVEVKGTHHVLDLAEGWVHFPGIRTDHIAITIVRWTTIRSVDPRTGTSTLVPPGVAEIEIPSLEDLVVTPDLDAPTGRVCGFGPNVVIDGVTVQTEVHGTIRDVFEGRPLRWNACGSSAQGIDVASGQHTLEVRADDMFAADSAVLRRLPREEGGARRAGTIEVRRWGSSSRTLAVNVADPALLIVPENANRGWVARAGGETLRTARVDGWQQAWELPRGYRGEVELTFEPQRRFEAGLLAGIVALFGLLVVAAIRRAGGDPVPMQRSRRTRSMYRHVAAMSGSMALGGVLAGWPGALAGGLAGGIRLNRRQTIIAGAAAAALAAAAIAVSVTVDSGWVDDLQVGACLPMVAIVGSAAIRAAMGDPDNAGPAAEGARNRTPVRVWIRLAYALIVVQLAWRAWSLSRSYFWQDDFIYIHHASSGLSMEFLLQDYHGHVMPGQFLLTWVLTELAPLAWLPAAALVLGLQLIASLLVLRLVRALVGDGPLGFAVLAVYLLSPITFTAMTWWASALQALPMQACMAWALLAHLRYLRTGSPGALGMTVVAVGVGLFFWEKALLIPVVLVVFTLLVGPLFTSRPLGELVRRQWPVLAAYVALAIGYGVMVLLVTEQEGSAFPTVTDVLQLVRFSIVDTFVPGIFGSMWGTEPAGATLAPSPSVPLLFVSWQLLAIAVVISLVCAGSAAARAWGLLFGYLLVDVALVALARLDFADPVVGRDPRYTADAVLVAVVALAAIGAAVRERRGVLPSVIWRGRALVVGILVLGLAITSLVSTYGAVARLPMGDARNFVTNAREAASRPGGVDLADGPVPDFVIAPFFVGEARASVAIGSLPEGPRFGMATADLRMLDGLGRARPIDVRRAAVGVPGEDAGCPWSIRRRQIRIPLDETVPEGRWIVRVGYYSGAPTTGRLEVDGRAADFALITGVHHVYVELDTPRAIRSISVGGLPAGDAACVTDVVIGTGWPRQEG